MVRFYSQTLGRGFSRQKPGYEQKPKGLSDGADRHREAIGQRQVLGGHGPLDAE